MKKNVLICDANHGGLTLLDEYSKYTDNNLFFYDIYNKLNKHEIKNYSNRYNVTFLNLEDINDEYTVIAPVHMNPVIPVDYTHHEFTSYLVDKHKNRYGWNFKIIQVTGVKGKTTTTSIISTILDDTNRLVLTSNALVYYCKDEFKVLKENLSITPSSIITALNIALEEDVLFDIEYFIVEVSLGVIPNQEISILTNILEDYSIANNTSHASLAKKSVFRSKYVICDKKSLDTYYEQEEKDNIISVSLEDRSSDLFVEDIKYDIDTTRFCIVFKDKCFDMKCFALTDFYVNNILFAISVGLLLNMDIEDMKLSLKNMKSIPGRTSYKRINDKLVVEEINPGLNSTSIKESVENISRYSNSLIIILGGDYGITCEEIDEEKLKGFIKSVKPNNIIFTGELGFNLYNSLNDNKYNFMEDVNEALKYALNKDFEIIEVIYRSRYSRKISLKYEE